MSYLLLVLSSIIEIGLIVVSGEQSLTNADLLHGTHYEIHRRAIINQIEHYKPAQKSLHTRHTISLDGLYDFCLDDSSQGFAQEWYSKRLNQVCRQGNFYRMPVPSAFNDITSNGTVRNYIGWFWYQTEISLSRSQYMTSELPKHWFIQFENINYLSIVWLQRLPTHSESSSVLSLWNSTQSTHLLGSHVGGHLPFMFNITDAIINEDAAIARFRLTIAVSNLLTKDTIPSGTMLNFSEQVGHSFYKFHPDFDFFHFAGILGSVNLIQLPQIHIQRVDILSGRLLIDGSSNSFNVCLSDYTLPIEHAKLRMNVVIVDSDEKLRGAGSLIKKDNQINIDQCYKLEIHSILGAEQMSWSLSNGDPRHISPLVKVRFQFEINISKNTIDQAGDRFVLHSYQTMSDIYELKLGVGHEALLDSKLLVRSKSARRQLQGFGMHHEQLFSGRTMNQAAIMKDLYLLKQTGANIIRTSHYPYSTEYLEACDENGMMVIAECPAVGLSSFSELKLMLHKQIILEMMQRDHHHPSIVMWSVANEPQSQLHEAKGYFESLLKYIREDLSQYIAGRPLTAAIAQSNNDDKIAHTLDVIMINRYYGWYDYTGVIEAIQLPLLASLTGWSQRYPSKPLILSEFGADALSGYHSSTGEIFSEEYQRDLLLQYEKVFDELFCNNQTHQINFWGSMIWNFADFSTHDSLLRVGGNKKGLFTSARQPKLSASSIASIYLNRQKNGCHNDEPTQSKKLTVFKGASGVAREHVALTREVTTPQPLLACA